MSISKFQIIGLRIHQTLIYYYKIYSLITKSIEEIIYSQKISRYIRIFKNFIILINKMKYYTLLKFKFTFFYSAQQYFFKRHMGACETKIRRKKLETTQSEDTPGQSTVRIELRRKTGLFGSSYCPIDNQEIENTEKELESFDPYILGLSGELIQEWKPVKFRKPSVMNQWWYFGEWKNKQRHGKGSVYNTVHEYLITGVFDSGSLFRSKCRKIFKNGSCFIGPLNENLDPQGQGELMTSSSDKFIGEFMNGIPNGQGRQFKKQYQFVGEFNNGMKVRGVLRNDKGVYEGQFEDNVRNGRGKMIYKNGEKFVGNFFKNKRHGFGTLYDAQGQVLKKGNWEHDKHPNS